jgi:hypothetical protein
MDQDGLSGRHHLKAARRNQAITGTFVGIDITVNAATTANPSDRTTHSSESN